MAKPDGTHDSKWDIWRRENGWPKNRKPGKFSKWEKKYMARVRRRVAKMKYLSLLLVFLLPACAMPPAVEYSSQPGPAAKAITQDEPIPSLLEIAVWLALYGMEVVQVDESPTWEASYPETGSQVVRFVWQAETIVPAVPYQDPAGLFTSLRVLTLSAEQDSFRIRVAGIDSLGNMGEYSTWGTFTGPEGPQLKE